MAEVRGNLIQLTGSLMSMYADVQKKADDALFAKTGKHWNQYSINDWVDAKFWDLFMTSYAEGSPSGERAFLTLGRSIYPTIKKAGQIPAEINTVVKMLEFEGEGFKNYHRGSDVKHRKFLKVKEGDVLVEAPSPGYNCKVIEGVFLGIVEMFNIKTGKVAQTKCIKSGGSTCEYHITW
jgi:predicted hydrocarbon binding protein